MVVFIGKSKTNIFMAVMWVYIWRIIRLFEKYLKKFEEFIIRGLSRGKKSQIALQN